MPPGSLGFLGRRWPAAALFALVAGAIAFGAWTGFPVFSDAVLPLIAHDSGVGSLAAKHADRPIYGWMVQATVSAFGFRRLPWIAVSLAAWGILAWLTARLHRLVFPDHPEWSWLPALLVLSPIVVQTQFVTLTIAYPGVAPVALVLGALLIGAGGAGRTRALGVLGLSALAVLVSEYGLAAAFAGALLAFGLRERRTALWLALGAACGALVFHLTADSSLRPDVTADTQLPKLAAAPVAGLYRWLSGTWHATIGAYGGAIWRTQLDAKSHASLAIAALGILGALLAAFAAKDAAVAEPARAERVQWRRLVVLILAVSAAVLPVAAAGRRTVFPADWTGDYESRFLLPALPFASVFLSGVVACAMTRRMQSVAAALLAFLCVEASGQGARQAMRSERWAEQLGRVLLPLVRSSDGITIAVGDDDPRLSWGTILTGKLSASWRDEDARRVWAMARSRASRAIGARADCRAPNTIEIDDALRETRRSGRLSSLVWVPAGDRVGPLEPYCAPER